MPTDKQKWSQIRNWDKKMITGAKGSLTLIKNSKAITPAERYPIELALCYLDLIIKFWDENNRESKINYLEKTG